MSRVYVRGGWVERRPSVPAEDGVEALVNYAWQCHLMWLDVCRENAKLLDELDARRRIPARRERKAA